MRHCLAIALLVAAGCGGAIAAEEDRDRLAYRCRGQPGFDSGQEVRLGRVKPLESGRSHFFRDDRDACPGDRACKLKAYLVPGDTVVVDRVAGGWACAWFEDKRGRRTMGYLRAGDLEWVEPAGSLPPAEWVGEWEDGVFATSEGHDLTSRLRFAVGADGRLVVDGEAYWYGGFVNGYENVHLGEIEGAALSLDRDRAVLAAAGEYECAATFQRLGDWLVVDDNGHCGGANVTFSGVYVRGHSRPAACTVRQEDDPLYPGCD